MGYMGLKHWGDSDRAADAYGAMIKQLIDSLNKELNEKGNGYNTCGVVNVALIIEDGLLETVPEFYIIEDFHHKKLLDGLRDLISSTDESEKAAWDDEDNRLEHRAAYKRMRDYVKVFIQKKQR